MAANSGSLPFSTLSFPTEISSRCAKGNMKYDWIEKTPPHVSTPPPNREKINPPICGSGRCLHRIFTDGPNDDYFVQILAAKERNSRK